MSAATDLFYELLIDVLGRPLTANKAHSMHPIQAQRARAEWRDTAADLVRANRIPKLSAISVVAQARYRTRRSPSDCDAVAPSVKGVIDGLVVAGIIPDDCPPFVQSITFVMPELGTGLPDALRVEIHPEPA